MRGSPKPGTSYLMIDTFQNGVPVFNEGVSECSSAEWPTDIIRTSLYIILFSSHQSSVQYHQIPFGEENLLGSL